MDISHRVHLALTELTLSTCLSCFTHHGGRGLRSWTRLWQVAVNSQNICGQVVVGGLGCLSFGCSCLWSALCAEVMDQGCFLFMWAFKSNDTAFMFSQDKDNMSSLFDSDRSSTNCQIKALLDKGNRHEKVMFWMHLWSSKTCQIFQLTFSKHVKMAKFKMQYAFSVCW